VERWRLYVHLTLLPPSKKLEQLLKEVPILTCVATLLGPQGQATELSATNTMLWCPIVGVSSMIRYNLVQAVTGMNETAMVPRVSGPCAKAGICKHVL